MNEKRGQPDVFICCFNRVQDGHDSTCVHASPPPPSPTQEPRHSDHILATEITRKAVEAAPPPSPTDAIQRFRQAVIAYHGESHRDFEDAQARASDMAEAEGVLYEMLDSYTRQREEIERLKANALTWQEALAIIEEDLTDKPGRSPAASSAIDKCVGILDEHTALRRLSSDSGTGGEK